MSDLFLALDLDNETSALKLAKNLSEFKIGFKVGPRLIHRVPQVWLLELAKLGPLFIDQKYFDIPKTMVASVQASFDAGASFVTVHALSGSEALRQLHRLETELNKIRPFKILVVTVLTSFTAETLPEVLRHDSIQNLTSRLAEEAYSCGLRSFVCSPLEVGELREKFPESYLVTPGVRLEGGESHDQNRIATPKEAIKKGASAIVIGRPILESKDPKKALVQILQSIK